MTRHKHADLIHAFAEGAEIQIKNIVGQWADCEYCVWHEDNEYRIKPRTVKREGWAVIDKYCGGAAHMEEHIYGSEDDAKKDYPYALNIIKIEWLEEA